MVFGDQQPVAYQTDRVLQMQRSLVQGQDGTWYEPAVDPQSSGTAAGVAAVSYGEASSDRNLSPTHQNAVSSYFSD
jgi:hypothetical protein